MSYHFSRALVEDYSQATCSDGELFAPLKSTTTQEAYCWRDKMTESLDLFQYGMTLQPSTLDLGAELLTWYRAAFPALTLALPAQCGDATALTATAAAYGMNTCGSLMSANLVSFGGRTRPPLKIKDSIKSFVRFPGAGTFADGSLSEPTTAVCPMRANAYGFTLPTPTSRDWKDTPGMSMMRKDGKTRADRLPMLLFLNVNSAGIKWKTMTDSDAATVMVRGLPVTVAGREYHPELPEWLMGWPIGWTDCEPLGTAKFQSWRQQHGGYSHNKEDA